MRLNPLAAGLIAVPIAFIVVFYFGFQIHSVITTIPDLVFAWAAVLCLVIIAFSIQWALMGFPRLLWRPYYSPSRREKSRIAHQTYTDWKVARRAELEASPLKQRYLPFFDKSDFWSDEQIEYNEDRTILATCVHLRRIEEAMRDAGISMKRITGPLFDQEAEPNVRAQCQVNMPKIEALFKPPSCVQFAKGYERDRSDYDNPWAHLYCSSCNSRIEATHPDVKAQTFPG